MKIGPGAQIGPWRLIRRLGAGGFGEVWEASGQGPETAALKMLRRDDLEPAMLRRFEREARTLLKLDHPNIVRALDFGQSEDGFVYLAMERLEGYPLDEMLSGVKQLPMDAALEVVLQAAQGLAAGHAAGVVHRDVKPSNLFVCSDTRVKVIDFGLALGADGPESTRLTRTGAVLGTPSYMAPEQASGEKVVDERADLWALGAVLQHALSGAPPFGTDHALAVMFRIISSPPTPLPASVPAAVADVVARCLEKVPADRFASMPALIETLTSARAALPGASSSGGVHLANADTLGAVAAGSLRGAPELSAEVRLVAAVVAEDVRDADAFGAAVRKRGGAASALIGARAVGIFGGLEWEGDEPERAVETALELRQHVGRMGVGTGKATVDARQTAGVTGAAFAEAEAAMHAAAAQAVQQGGHPGVATVGVCPETRRRIKGRFRVDGVRALEAKPGLRSLGSREVGGAEVPFVGRELELGRLQALIERARDENRAQCGLVIGPPGIGKSRLRWELQRWLEDHEGKFRYGQGRGEAGRVFSSWATLRWMLRARAEVPDGTPPALARSRIETMVTGSGLQGETARRVTAFLCPLMRVAVEDDPDVAEARRDPRQMGQRMRDAVVELFDAWLQEMPLVVIVEDVHWADHASLAALEEVLVRLEDRPLTLIATARPELSAENADLFPGAEKVMLRELSNRAVGDIVRCILGTGFPEGTSAEIVQRAAGNPFFAEELALAVRDGSGIDALPATVEGAVQARLDKLGAAQKDTLKRAAVLGRNFWVEGVQALGEHEAPRILASLRRRDVVSPRSSSRLADCREWLFRHAVMHEVCHNMLTPDQQVGLHALAAQWLQGRPDSSPDAIAVHLEAAGDLEEAGLQYLEAAKLADAVSAIDEAAAHYEKAAALLPAGTSHVAARLATLEGLGGTLVKRMRLDEATAQFHELIGEAEEAGDQAASASAYIMLARASNERRDYSLGNDDADRGLEIAQRLGNGRLMTRALIQKLQPLKLAGDHQATFALAEKIVATARASGDEEQIAWSLQTLANASRRLMRFEDAERYGLETLERFRTLRFSRGIGLALNSLGETERVQGRYAAAMARYEQAVEVDRAGGDRPGLLIALMNLAGIHVRLGNTEQARRLVDELRSIVPPNYFAKPEIERLTGELHLHDGAWREASEAAQRGLGEAPEQLIDEMAGPLWRVLGDALSKMGEPVDVAGNRLTASDCYARSTEIFRQDGLEREQAATLLAWARLLESGEDDADRTQAAGLRQRGEEIAARLDLNLADEGRF